MKWVFPPPPKPQLLSKSPEEWREKVDREGGGLEQRERYSGECVSLFKTGRNSDGWCGDPEDTKL